MMASDHTQPAAWPDSAVAAPQQHAHSSPPPVVGAPMMDRGRRRRRNSCEHDEDGLAALQGLALNLPTVVVRAPLMQSPSIVVPKLFFSDDVDFPPPIDSPTCSSPSPPASAGGSVEDSRTLFWGRPSAEGALSPTLAFDLPSTIDQARPRVLSLQSLRDPCFHHPSSPRSRSIAGAIPEHETRRTRTTTGARRRPHRGACGAVPAMGSASVIDRAVRLAELSGSVDGRRRTESADF